MRWGLCVMMVCLMVCSDMVLLGLLGCILIRFVVGLKLWKWICDLIV